MSAWWNNIKKVSRKENAKRIADVLLSKIFVGRGFIDNAKVTSLQEQIQAPKMVCYETKWHNPRGQDSNAINSDASLKDGNKVGGLSVIARNAQGIPTWLEMSWEIGFGSLTMEALAMLRGTELSLASWWDIAASIKTGSFKASAEASFKTDAKYVTRMIEDDRYLPDGLDEYAKECVFFLRATLKHTGWTFTYACRQSNSVADYLARRSRELKLKHWPDPKDYTHSQDVIVTHKRIYMKGCVPRGLKTLLLNDIGLFPMVAMKKNVSQNYDVQVPNMEASLGDKNMEILHSWTNDLAKFINEKWLKCFFIEIWDTTRRPVLVEEYEVRVIYHKDVDVVITKDRLFEFLCGFEVLNKSLYPLDKNRKLQSKLVFQFLKNDSEEVKKHILQQKVRVELPATLLTLDPLEFDNILLLSKITTKYGRKANINYHQWETKLESFKKELKNIPEYDFGDVKNEIDLVFPANKIMRNGW